MKDLIPLEDWGFVKSVPAIIAGPCSAETEEQLFDTCKAIKEKTDVSLFRAGIWKPRTRPGSFEGIGEEALEWYKTVKDELEIPVALEVATAKHVESALKYEMDVLWIGARSTANPFTVQEIADALQGVDIPVIVKNPVNPDLALWIGAIERVYNAGIRKIGALHRGFSSYGEKEFRNAPMWQLPIALKSDFPQIPLFCDPSHIGGKRDLILPISQKAVDLNYDGLMIETHINPDEALSDAKQQVTPDALVDILASIKVRSADIGDESLKNKLAELRSHIDQIDEDILSSLANRMGLVGQIGDYKKENDITIFQAKRWVNIFQNRPEQAKKMGLSTSFIEQLFKLIHDESIRIQTKILNS